MEGQESEALQKHQVFGSEVQAYLSSFTPHDLRDDLRYMEFIESLQSEIESTDLKQSTLDGYLGYLTGKVLKYGKVKPRIVEEVKTQVILIKKGLKRRRSPTGGSRRTRSSSS